MTPRVEPLGDAALLVTIGDASDEATRRRVARAARLLSPLGECVPGFTTLTLHLSGAEPAGLDALLARVDEPGVDDVAVRLVEIPVCYAAAFAPDLEVVSRHTGLPAEEVVRRHAAKEYRVHLLGFIPGFPYLAGLDPGLATPRRDTPRSALPPGSVGIGGAQTGVYPMSSPGGWQLIGRTPLRLFDPHRDPPALLRPGDRVRFRPIDEAEYRVLEAGE
jgi:inhibitor of KinA